MKKMKLIIGFILISIIACNDNSKPIQKDESTKSLKQEVNLQQGVRVYDELNPDPTDLPGMYRCKEFDNSAVEGRILIDYICDPANIKKDRFITYIHIAEPHRSLSIGFNKCRKNIFLLDSTNLNWKKLDLRNATEIGYSFTEDQYGMYNIDSPRDTAVNSIKPSEIKKIWHEHYKYFKVLK